MTTREQLIEIARELREAQLHDVAEVIISYTVMRNERVMQELLGILRG